jgi:hypothetical protein
MLRYWLLTLATVLVLAGTAHAQTPTPVTAASPVVGDPAGWRVLARGKCLVDPSASLADGAETIVSCAASGAMIGSLVISNIETTSDVSDVFIKRAAVTENGRVDFSFGSYGATQNPGVLSIVFAVVQ